MRSWHSVDHFLIHDLRAGRLTLTGSNWRGQRGIATAAWRSFAAAQSITYMAQQQGLGSRDRTTLESCCVSGMACP